MLTRPVATFATAAAVLLLGGCATPSAEEAAPAEARSERAAATETRDTAPRPAVTATEVAASERRGSTSATREGGSGTPAEMAKLVDQLNEAARELATLRTANAKLRAERARPAAEAAPAPAAAAAPAPAPKAEPAEEKLAASLKSYAQFRQEVTNLVGEIERLKKANADLSAELKGLAEQARQAKTSSSELERLKRANADMAAELKTLGEQARQSKTSSSELERLKKTNAEMAAELKSLTDQSRQAKSAQARLEEDLRVEKRLRLEAEGNAGQLRDQLRTIARAMSEVGVAAGEGTGAADGRSRNATRYRVREGDTLLKIADRMYGDAEKWRVIMEANRGKVGTDGTVEVGTELQIPRN